LLISICSSAWIDVLWIRGLHVQIIKQSTRQIWSATILMQQE
jgi:hypothetical protein